MKIKRNQKGFTLIEVVLVLAIGGLIFLLAFLAFQQVSANRRDTARRSDAGRMIAEVENYFGDKNAYPTATCTLSAAGTTTTFRDVMRDYLKDPKGPTNAAYSCVTAAPAAAEQVRFSTGACPNGSGSVKVEVWIEKGTVYCRDNG